MKVRNFQHQTTLPLSLENFISLNHLSIETIYKKIVGQDYVKEQV
jgi:hypothetical protein